MTYKGVLFFVGINKFRVDWVVEFCTARVNLRYGIVWIWDSMKVCYRLLIAGPLNGLYTSRILFARTGLFSFM